ncbi:amidohydrolase family protein [Streptomyces sp. NPDC101116]|uniref:amidohydrolase family protein n=2 Tax=unclassified Streptomyces TaxID=2593676 RepID=UPI003822126C
MQCIASLPETADLLALADEDPLIGAVVGWTDLTAADAGDTLDALRAGTGGSYLRAVRHLVQEEPDPRWLQQPAVERGLRAVQDRGLGYDVLIHSHQFPQAIRLARRFPELPLVLDHAGKPPVDPRARRGTLPDWQRGVRALAGFPQVRCKVSGLITEADHRAWTVADIRPVWDTLLAAFGPHRLMFGSDWPSASWPAAGRAGRPPWTSCCTASPSRRSRHCCAPRRPASTTCPRPEARSCR